MEEENKNVEETKTEEVAQEPVVEQETPTEEQVVSETNNEVKKEEVAQDAAAEQPATETVQEEKKEDTPKKSKKSSIWLIVIILVFMLFTFGLGIYFGKEVFTDKSGNKKENTNTETNTNTEVENNNNDNTNIVEDNTNNEKPEDNQNLVFDDNAKNKVNDFIKTAMHVELYSDDYAKEFSNGLNALNKKQKELLTYFATANDDNMTQLTLETVPTKYKNDEKFKYINGVDYRIYELPLQIFANKYKEFFNEEYVVESEEPQISGCPFVFKIDQELGKMYLSNQCGGTSDFSWDYLYLNYQYETDENYYYVYQYNGEYVYNHDEDHIDFKKSKSGDVIFTMPRTVGVRLDINKVKEQFELNADKFETVKWTFDKNLVFVSTENLG